MRYEFTVQDIDILIEALDAWTSKDSLSMALMSSITALTSRSKEEYDTHMNEIRKKDLEKKEKIAENKEISILLKAKLILRKQEIERDKDLPAHKPADKSKGWQK